MIEFLILFLAVLGWLALLTCALFLAGRRLEWCAKPPAIDLIFILFTVVPWVGGWQAGAPITRDWRGGVAGVVAAVAAQFGSSTFSVGRKWWKPVVYGDTYDS
jgi:hypothetical protein